ncbi:hypothetical protein EYS14_19585 [Alteromonadaceae bacterium M269]|nr:hypothetical protein EYS14_19585 [Alteromonadaceae bacterium M269]
MNILTKLFVAGAFVASVPFAAWSSNISSSGKYVIDQNHSGVTFKVSHLGFTNLVGRFNEMSGDITASDNKSSLNVVIKTASIDTNHDKRDDHLRSPDFFNAKQFPTISFSSALDVRKVKGKDVIDGELTMLGVSKPVRLQVEKGNEGKDPWGLYRVGYIATTTVKRSDFGMNFMQEGIGDDIQVVINIEAVKQ